MGDGEACWRRGSPRSRPAPSQPQTKTGAPAGRARHLPLAPHFTLPGGWRGPGGQRTGKSFMLHIRVPGPAVGELRAIYTSSSLQSFRPDLSLVFRRMTLSLFRSPGHTGKRDSEWLNDLQTHCQCREEYNGLSRVIRNPCVRWLSLYPGLSPCCTHLEKSHPVPRMPCLGLPPSSDLPQSPQTNFLVTSSFSQNMVNGTREPGNLGLDTGSITALWPLGKQLNFFRPQSLHILNSEG